jgi:hypothetical protein
MASSAIVPFRAMAPATPMPPARKPIQRDPVGWVPMQAERMPMARPRLASGAESSTRVLCIAANPDSQAPISTSGRQAQGQRTLVKASSRNGATRTQSANTRPWGRNPRRPAMASAPSSAPSPSAATRAPSHSGPTRRTSWANTGSMC